LPARKRWRLAGLALLCLGWVVWQTPSVLRHGWAGAIPGWALANWAPVKTDAADISTVRDRLTARLQMQGAGYNLPRRAVPLPPPPKGLARLKSDVYLETWRRVQEGDLSDAMTARYVRRLFGVTPRALVERANLPPAWPSDRRLPAIASFTDTSGTRLIPSAPCRAERIDAERVRVVAEVDIDGRVVTIAQATAPVDSSVSAERFMRRVGTPAANDTLVRTLRPTVSLGQQTVRVEFTGRSDASVEDVPFAVSMRARLLLDGKELAAGTCEYEPLCAAGHSPVFAHMRWDAGAAAQALARSDELELELTGRPARGLVDYVTRATTLRDVWSGSVRVKPRVIHDK